MALRMLEEHLHIKEGDEIVTTAMEHHSSIVPLQQLAKRTGAVLRIIPLEEGGIRLDMGKAAELITPKTKLVAVMQASNVTGTINDISRLAELAHQVGAIIIVDGSASVGHISVSVRGLGVDMFYFSAHKMLGPTGMGVLWVRGQLLEQLEPMTWGGGMIERVTEAGASWGPLPDRFEAGTKNIGGAIGLGAAIGYLNTIGIDALHAHVAELVGEAIKQLEAVPGVALYTERDAAQNVGNVAFTVEGVHPHDVAQVLAQEGVAVRPGHHCAQPLHKALGVSATTRARFYLYNTKEDIDALVRGIEKAKQIFG
jgi:cysteine desulfurase/selenocysteine lyase